MARRSDESIYSGFKKFRKCLNGSIHADDMIGIDYEYGLDRRFLKEDADELSRLLGEMESEIKSIRESMK